MHVEFWNRLARRALLGLVLIEVSVMSACVYRDAGSPAEGGGTPQSSAAAQPLFAKRDHVGWFEVIDVQAAPSEEPTHIPGIMKRRYRVSLKVLGSIGEIEPAKVVVIAEKSDHFRAGQLGLPLWMPTEVGQQVVMAFDQARMNNAENMVYLADGKQAQAAWEDCVRYRDTIVGEPPPDAGRVVTTINGDPTPGLVFFRLLYEGDQRVFNSPRVCRAFGNYFENDQLGLMERRQVAAHYLAPPEIDDRDSMTVLATGLLRLALALHQKDADDQAEVVLERLADYGHDEEKDEWLPEPAQLTPDERNATVEMLRSSDIELESEQTRLVRDWVNAGTP